MTKILNFMGLTYKDLYSPTLKSHIARETLYKENTNVLSYYIITFILLNHFQDFINWCYTNNTDGSLLQFNKSDANIKRFCSFIQKNYKTNIKHLNLQHICDDFYIYNNTRMSILEIE